MFFYRFQIFLAQVVVLFHEQQVDGYTNGSAALSRPFGHPKDRSKHAICDNSAHASTLGSLSNRAAALATSPMMYEVDVSSGGNSSDIIQRVCVGICLESPRPIVTRVPVRREETCLPHTFLTIQSGPADDGARQPLPPNAVTNLLFFADKTILPAPGSHSRFKRLCIPVEAVIDINSTNMRNSSYL